MFRHRGKDQAAEAERSSLYPVALAVELMDRAFTGEAGPDEDEPPWPVLFGRAPTAYEIAKVTDPSEREELARRAVAEKMTGAEVRAVRGGKAARPRPRRIDLRDPNGCTVTVTIPDGLDDDDAFTALQRAVKNWRKTRGKQDAA